MKKHRLAKWIKKKTHQYAAYKRFTSDIKDTNRLKVKGQKKTFHENGNQEKAGIAIITSDKIDFKTD